MAFIAFSVFLFLHQNGDTDLGSGDHVDVDAHAVKSLKHLYCHTGRFCWSCRLPQWKLFWATSITGHLLEGDPPVFPSMSWNGQFPHPPRLQ